jgi:hypothetical protein
MSINQDGTSSEFYKSGSRSEKLAGGIESLLSEKYGLSVNFDLSGEGKTQIKPKMDPKLNAIKEDTGGDSSGFLI